MQTLALFFLTYNSLSLFLVLTLSLFTFLSITTISLSLTTTRTLSHYNTILSFSLTTTISLSQYYTLSHKHTRATDREFASQRTSPFLLLLLIPKFTSNLRWSSRKQAKKQGSKKLKRNEEIRFLKVLIWSNWWSSV